MSAFVKKKYIYKNSHTCRIFCPRKQLLIKRKISNMYGLPCPLPSTFLYRNWALHAVYLVFKTSILMSYTKLLHLRGDLSLMERETWIKFTVQLVTGKNANESCSSATKEYLLLRLENDGVIPCWSLSFIDFPAMNRDSLPKRVCCLLFFSYWVLIRYVKLHCSK